MAPIAGRRRLVPVSGATVHTFAGVSAVTVSLRGSESGAFSIKVKLSRKLKPGTYSLATVRRRHVRFAGLKVTKAA